MNEIVEPELFNLAEAWFLFFQSTSELEPLAYYGSLGFHFIIVNALWFLCGCIFKMGKK